MLGQRAKYNGFESDCFSRRARKIVHQPREMKRAVKRHFHKRMRAMRRSRKQDFVDA